MVKDISIAGRLIGASHPPYIVAEMSGNHNQSFDKGVAILKAAKDAGADEVGTDDLANCLVCHSHKEQARGQGPYRPYAEGLPCLPAEDGGMEQPEGQEEKDLPAHVPGLYLH